MKDIMSFVDPATLYFCIIYPGITSIITYRLLSPKQIDWASIIYQAAFYGTAIFFIINPAISFVLEIDDSYLRSITFFLLITLPAIILPFIVYKMRKLPIIHRYLIDPYPSSWDYVFSKREQFYIIAHLTNGDKVCGYFGNNSCANSTSSGGDIYIRWAYHVDSDGKIIGYKENSCGLYIKRESILYMEFFTKEEEGNE